MPVTHPAPATPATLMRCLGATSPMAALMPLTKSFRFVAAPPSSSPAHTITTTAFLGTHDLGAALAPIATTRMRGAKFPLHAPKEPAQRPTSSARGCEEKASLLEQRRVAVAAAAASAKSQWRK